MKNSKLYIVMVGLPARGKSTIATKIRENLKNDSVKSRIFNNGALRRRLFPQNTSVAEFYRPENREGMAVREKIAMINMERARNYLRDGGDVAILDATNASLARRKKIRSYLDNHPMLFIECINENAESINASILRKIDTSEFRHFTKEDAIKSFEKRISYYVSIYSPLKTESDFVKVDSLNKKIIQEEIRNDLPYYEQIRDLLITDTVRHLYLIRHGETYFNLENRIGGDSSLTENGRLQAEALAKYFSKRDIPLIFTSEKKRTIQTAESIKALQKNCTIIPLAEFNEINSGICESMSYEEIRKAMPHVYNTRKKNKYNYVYPEGESYATMKQRIEQGINKVLYLSAVSKNIMIIGHRAANRMILSHFFFRREEDVPYIYMPMDMFYYISASQKRKLFQLRRYQ
jgi:broad specificity phosphatase PhoE/predicted kinase